MRRQVIAGGSYCEAHPNGSYAVLVGHNVIVNGAAKPNPFGSDYPMYLRSTSSGEFAGQGHNSGRVLRYVLSGWMAEGTTCGVNPVCYAPDGSLVVNDHCQYGTQGIRWIDPDGTIHTGDQTYDGRGTTGVAEWTHLGSVLLGQSYVDGCTIKRDGDIPRQLEPGHCTFVRFNLSGSQCAVALWKQLENCAVLFWFDVSEIASLVPEPTAPNPDPDPDPDPPDPDPESPSMDFPRTEWGIVEQVHARFQAGYPATEDGARAWTKQAIEQLAFSFPAGGWCWKSSTPTNPPSKDCIARRIDGRFEGWDVLNAAGAQGPRQLATYPPAYHDLIAEGNQHPIPVTATDHLGTVIPDPDPDPDPPNGDVSQAIKDYVDAVVKAEVSLPMLLLRELEDRTSQHLLALRVRVKALEDMPGPLPTLPADVVRESTHKVVTGPIRVFGVNAGTYDGKLVKK